MARVDGGGCCSDSLKGTHVHQQLSRTVQSLKKRLNASIPREVQDQLEVVMLESSPLQSDDFPFHLLVHRQ